MLVHFSFSLAPGFNLNRALLLLASLVFRRTLSLFILPLKSWGRAKHPTQIAHHLLKRPVCLGAVPTDQVGCLKEPKCQRNFVHHLDQYGYQNTSIETDLCLGLDPPCCPPSGGTIRR